MRYPNQVDDLLQRYLRQVERQLPSRVASDVVQELDSLLRDQLDARSEEAGRPVDFAMTVELLKTFGSPRETANRFHPMPRYLIGPSTYPIFLKVAGIVAGALALAAFIPCIVALVSGSLQGFGWVLLRGLGGYIQSLWGSLGVLVVVFAVLDRRGLGDGKLPGQDWDPLELPELPKREEDRINLASALAEMLSPLFLMLFLYLLPAFSFFSILPGPAGPILQHLSFEKLGIPLPMSWITGCLIAQSVLGFVLLRTGCWNVGLRWAKILLGLCSVGILGWIAVHAMPPAPESLVPLVPLHVAKLLLQLVYVLLKLMPVLMLISIVPQAWRLVRSGYGKV